jgi:hypothetical protein
VSGRKINLQPVRDGLARLDALVEAYPELRSPEARARMAAWLEEEQQVRGRQKGKQIFVRLPDELTAEVDTYAEILAKERPGLRPSRSDAIRVLLYKGLEAVKEHKAVTRQGEAP